MKWNVLLIIFFTVLLLPEAQANNVVITNLKTEYSTEPPGIDAKTPRFSWNMQSDRIGAAQKAYQIVVTDEHGKTVWNSGRVRSNVSLNIRYAGISLQARTRYHWELTVWDDKYKKRKASSWFETGLMNAGIGAWKGAQWIGVGDDDLPFYPHYLPVFKISCKIQLDKASATTKASFVYGANDNRLMCPNMNIFQLKSDRNESYIRLELDITPLNSDKEAVLNIYRVGYHPNDQKDKPLRSFQIPLTLINNDNKYEKHQINVSTNLGHTTILINNGEIGRHGLNPLGQGGDFIAFPVLGDIGFQVSSQQKAQFSDIEIRNYRSPSNLLFSYEFKEIEGLNAEVFETFNPEKNSMPVMRTTFDVEKELKKARLYVTARGVYDVYLNGERLGNDYFNPGKTQYNKTQMYQTFDVTALVRTGKNALGAMLGEGWWSGAATYMGEYWNFFGDRQSLLAKLVLSYADGSESVVATNPATWKYFNDGPVVSGSFFQGEVYDARKESLIKGWSTADYDASAWQTAREIPLKGTVSFKEDDYNELKFMGQYDQTVKPLKELTAKSVIEVRPGVFVYDMGQNMVGVPKISLSDLKPGQRIILRFAEVKYPDMPEYKNNVGMIMLENIRAAMSQDIYIAKGGNETIQPRFTFHGYRFIEITGIEQALPLESVKGIVLSSVQGLSSSYKTSNEKVNKLWENITWSMYGNFLSIPTDCPQRNERLGWSGDISVFARAAGYLADVPQFLRKQMLAMRDTQRENGRFPDVAPLDVGFGGILWGSAGITVPWELYQQYNDVDLLSEHYDAMKKYIRFILNNTIEASTGVIVQDRAWGDLADWLAPEDGRNDKSLLWEAYFIYDLEIMQKVAAILGKSEDARWFADLHAQRKKFFSETYLQQETAKTVYSAFDQRKKGNVVDTQTSYVLPLVFDVLNNDEKKKVAANLVEAIKRENVVDNKKVPPYSLMTGFIGTAWISKALSDNGHTEVAYNLLQQTTYPSWLYSVEQGATTIWERLNSYTHNEGFAGGTRMNSFNHYSFGAVASWMYNYSLGIERDALNPGFKHFYLKPEVDPTGQMTSARGHYDSMYGRIESGWQVEGRKTTYRFVVPANTTATLMLKASSVKDIKVNGKPVLSNKNVRFLKEENGKLQFNLQPGIYNFVVDDPDK